jgi:hypothetical protein
MILFGISYTPIYHPYLKTALNNLIEDNYDWRPGAGKETGLGACAKYYQVPKTCWVALEANYHLCLRLR